MVTAWIGSLCIVLLILFQVLLALGFPLGEYSMGGKHKVFPPTLRIASIVSAILLSFALYVLLSLGNVIQPNDLTTWHDYAGYSFGSYLCLNTILNLVSPSKKERAVMTPLSAILAFCFFYTTYNAAG